MTKFNNRGSHRGTPINSVKESMLFVIMFIYMVTHESRQDEVISAIILRQFHIETTPLNVIDGGIMVGSVDGYQWIPKRLRVLYCFQFVKKKKKSLCTESIFSH